LSLNNHLNMITVIKFKSIKEFMKKLSTTFFSILFLSLFAQAQFSLSPAPVSSEIVLSSSNTYIYITNNSGSIQPVSISVGTNSNGISLSLNRCSTSLKINQSCYVVVSFPSYATNSQTISLPLKNGATTLSSLKFNPTIFIPQTSNFSISSLVMNDFNAASFVVQNKTSSTKSYSPAIGGTDASKYSVTLNRCSSIPAGGTCLAYVKLAPQMAGSFSASITEPQVTGSISISSTITGATVGVIQPPNPSISIAPASVSIGTLTQIGSSSAQSITITNNGNVSISPIVSVSGTGLSIILNRCITLVAPNQSCSVSVVFTATSSMTNGVQSGLSVSAQATSTTTLLNVPVSVSLNINPLLLSSSGGNFTLSNPYIVFSNNGSDGYVYDARTKSLTSLFPMDSYGSISVEDTTYFGTSSDEIYKITAANPTPELVLNNFFNFASLGENTSGYSERTPMVNGKKIFALAGGDNWYAFSKDGESTISGFPTTAQALGIYSGTDAHVSGNYAYIPVQDCNPTCNNEIIKTDGTTASIVAGSVVSGFDGYIYGTYKIDNDVYFMIRDSAAVANTFYKILPNGTSQLIATTSDGELQSAKLVSFAGKIFVFNNGQIKYLDGGVLNTLSSGLFLGIANSKMIINFGSEIRQIDTLLNETTLASFSSYSVGQSRDCEMKSSIILCTIYSNNFSATAGLELHDLIKIDLLGNTSLISSDFIYANQNNQASEVFFVLNNHVLYFVDDGAGMLTIQKSNLTTNAASIVNASFQGYTDTLVDFIAGSYVFHDSYGEQGNGLIIAPDLTSTHTLSIIWMNKKWWNDDQ
jgi:hypothetical protein